MLSTLPTSLVHMPDRATRIAISALNAINRRHVLEVHGIDRLLALPDPFIVVINHSSYAEALLLPALFTGFRKGRLIRFMADWNFLMIPVVASFFKMGRIIPVTTKAARPRWLTRFRDVLVRGAHGLELAKSVLENGESVGIFPEGKVNKNPDTLLRGRKGAARLAIETGVPVLPVGVQYPFRTSRPPLWPGERMTVYIGKEILPSYYEGKSRADVHQHIMQQLASLSGKRTFRNP